MIVCGHGDVLEFCENHEMVVADTYNGNIEEYEGVCPVLVTDQTMTENEYLYMKKKMLVAGVELVSIHHTDEETVSKQMVYESHRENQSRKEKYGGRCRFGFRRVNGKEVPDEYEMQVVRRILELKDSGHTLRAIHADSAVRRIDGSKPSISTIQVIVANRESYEV